MKNQDITVIIRSSSERTEQLCLERVTQQVDRANVFVINEKPFSAAVRKNFQLGIDQNKKWTLAIDADVLIFEGCIENMICEAEKLDEDYFIYQGWVYDHFFCEIRAGGPHLYRTSLLPMAITLIPEEGSSLRPESDTYHQMRNAGYYMYQDVKNFGLHDFEQTHFDIYRKFFLHAHKHVQLVSTFLNSWKEHLTQDLDYKVAMRGLADGLLYQDTVFVDTRFFEQKANHLFEVLGLQEKSKNFSKMDKIVFDKFRSTPLLATMQMNPSKYLIDTKPIPTPTYSLLFRIKRKTKYLSAKLFNSVGHIFIQIGKQCEKFS